MGGLGLGLEDDAAGEADNLEGGLADVVLEGVIGRPVGFAGGGGWTGDLRERKGEMEDRRGPPGADILGGEKREESFRCFGQVEITCRQQGGRSLCRLLKLKNFLFFGLILLISDYTAFVSLPPKRA